eukprot:1157780-Pelagomonas_calceolata.AAC.20
MSWRRAPFGVASLLLAWLCMLLGRVIELTDSSSHDDAARAAAAAAEVAAAEAALWSRSLRRCPGEQASREGVELLVVAAESCMHMKQGCALQCRHSVLHIVPTGSSHRRCDGQRPSGKSAL